jgi:hypothetical protein
LKLPESSGENGLAVRRGPKTPTILRVSFLNSGAVIPLNFILSVIDGMA